jgi:hypothetical protein
MDEVVVHCPSCSQHALVRPAGDAPDRVARLTCLNCGYSQAKSLDWDRAGSWRGPVHISAHGRCGTCGQWLVASGRSRSRPPAANSIAVQCRGCGGVTDLPVNWSPISLQAVDPYFGLPLWFRAACCGETLWAYNRRHLAFLRGFVGAKIRQRYPNRNASMVSRLPNWMKKASNRAAILNCIADLENKGA